MVQKIRGKKIGYQNHKEVSYFTSMGSRIVGSCCFIWNQFCDIWHWFFLKKKMFELNSAGCLVLKKKKKKWLSDFVKNKFLHDSNFKFQNLSCIY